MNNFELWFEDATVECSFCAGDGHFESDTDVFEFVFGEHNEVSYV